MNYGIGKLLIGLGAFLAFLGALIVLSERFPWLRLGRLPGDIAYQKDGFGIYIPITTMALLSLIGSLVLWLINRGRG